MLRARPWAWLAGGGVGLLAAGGLFLRGLVHLPAPVEEVTVHCRGDARTARAGEPLDVLVWNVQYSAGVAHEFFYDGGEAVRVDGQTVTETLDAIAERIREHDPDVILFQELDRGSDRTARIDQVAALLARLDYPCHASAPYHRVLYVPTPDHEHLGRVDMHLAVFSRVRLGQARRHQLALLDEPAWRRLFNLRRAVLEVTVPVDGGPDLVLLDTHLSAFSKGDGTLPRQVGQLGEIARHHAQAGRAVILAGDLNALPPGEDPATVLEKDRVLYSDAVEPLTPLYEALEPALPLETYRADRARWFTYVPFGQAPDRTIDHAFSAGPVQVSDLRVDPQGRGISDHLPFTLTAVVSTGE